MPGNTIIVVVAILARAALAQAQQPTAPAAAGRGAPQPRAIQQVKPGLYMITGGGGNTTVRVTSPGPGAVKVELHHFGRAHTSGDTVVYFDAAIPGNGDVLAKADIQAYKTKFETVIARASELVRMGVPQDQLLAQIKTDDIGWAPRVPKMDAFYAELSETK